MALREILIAGNPILREKSKKVRAPQDPAIQRLIDDMLDTMHDGHGVGLAAPQVGVLLRVIVIHVPPEEEGAEIPEPVVLMNPVVVKRSGERIVEEGCLSIPGWRGEVTRSVSVTVKGLNREGREIRIKASENLLAQALEHEIDHLDGVLYIDHLTAPEKLWKLDQEEIELNEADGERDSKEEGELVGTAQSGL